jgi:hypothetical protein
MTRGCTKLSILSVSTSKNEKKALITSKTRIAFFFQLNNFVTILKKMHR